MAEIRFETKLERRNLPDGLSDEQKANYKVPIEADADLLRYGLYGQDGIIRNFGNGLAHLIAGPNFTIRSGKGAIHGRTFIVDSAGITYNVGTSSTVVYFVVYAEINMSVSSAERAEIVFAWQTGFYPVIPFGDDLTQHNTGVARAELYRFQASGGVISNVQQNFHIISYAKYYIPGLVQIPSSVDIEIVSIDGNGINVVEQTGILYPGWYMVELSAGGGGGNAGYSNNPIYGGNGGYLRSTFFVSHKANYKLMAGGGGEGGEGTGKSQESGGGGGGSVLDIPQLGIVFIATGGGGAGSAVGGDNRGGGGGGGGYGGGGSGRVTSGGAGGGASGGYGGRSGGGAGGGMNGGSGYGTGGFGGGASGNGGAYIINGENGGNNLNNELGGGAKGGFGSGIGSYGSNGFARIYRLVDPD